MRILNLSKETKETALKRLVNQIGDETPLLVLLTLADKEASRGILSIQIDEVVENHCLRILELFNQKDIVHPPPFITGHDVMVLGYSPGPRVGQILHFIRQKQVEGEIKNREEALRILKENFDQNFPEIGIAHINNSNEVEKLKKDIINYLLIISSFLN
jgi:tRNA nucleotidyltransferase/poly(A) polymerase